MKVKKRYEKSFTTVDNSVLNDTNLSWKAKGLFVYLWSQADEWDFYESEVAKHSTDGLSSLKSGIKELEKQGYLRRERKRDDKGYFRENNWILSENPMCENRMLDNRTLTNTNNNNTNNNKTLSTQDSINTKDYEDDTTKENNTKNRDNTKNKDNNKKDNDNKKDKDKESNSNINNNRVNTNKDLKGNRDNNRVKENNRVNTKDDLKGNIENECSEDKKESKGRGSSVNTKIDNTCNEDLKGSKDNFDYKRFIEWFNKLADKNFRDTETNRKMIRSRLNEGYTKEDVAKVVRLKVREWKDNPKMNKYLRFTTLFAATNFSNYLQEAEDTLEPQEKKKRESSAKEKTRKTNPVEEKIYQYKLFLSEHPDNKVIKEALERLEQNKE
jgi:uncharacterized phage protein (TIGR02220 family)